MKVLPWTLCGRLIWFADKNKNKGTKPREGSSLFDPLEFIQ